MTLKDFVFTSESVSEGHPDKICDQISDAILDECLRQDEMSRVACETVVKNHVVCLAGEITLNGSIEYEKVVRQVIREIGYTDPMIGFDSERFELLVFVNEQSADISMGVNEGEGSFTEQGAGDQGLMFGFACDETEELMPLPISLSHRLMKELADQRKAGIVDYLRPDSKAQVSVCYQDGKPHHVDAIVVSTQHTEDAKLEQVQEYVRESIIQKIIPKNLLNGDTRYFINPTGRFVIGGPVGDAGLTGRKIIVDTYGGYSRHGGGAFSGKDPTKVDRSAAYAARYIAKNIVSAGLASKCEVQLAYAIGVAEPISIFVDTFETSQVAEEKIGAAVSEAFELTPGRIIETLNLRNPIYSKTAAYGHFGRAPSDEGHFSWEKTDKVEDLKAAVAS